MNHSTTPDTSPNLTRGEILVSRLSADMDIEIYALLDNLDALALIREFARTHDCYDWSDDYDNLTAALNDLF
jgi:hypothetical protein